MFKINQTKIRLPLKSTVLVLVGFLLTMTSVAAVNLGYDPFLRYGKTLPWSDLNFNDAQAMILTRTPNDHLFSKGYYAQDFARYFETDTLNTPVHAISDGQVVELKKDNKYNGGLGNYIILDHGNGYTSRYSHLQLVAVRKNDMVRKGQEIGIVGSSGNVSKANLEFALFYNGQSVKATIDGIPYDGFYANPVGSGQWGSFKEPVPDFGDTVQKYAKFRSITEPRPDDEDNVFDPPVFDPLDRYMEFYGYKFPAGMVAEPVNAATGNFVHRKQDLQVFTNSSLELEFTRFYNSQSDYAGSLSRGWSHSWDIRILAHTSGEFTVKFADGRGEIFKPLEGSKTEFEKVSEFGNGTLTRLDEEGGYKFIYTDTDRTKYTFGSANSGKWGKLERVETIDRDYLNLTYDGATGTLQAVEDGFKNKLTFSYNADNTLAQVQDSLKRSVHYVYNFDGLLEEVVLADGSSWQYEYDVNGQLTNVTDARGVKFVQNIYDDEGRVTTQLDGKDGLTTIKYEGSDRVTATLTQPDGSKEVYSHNDNNYLESVVDDGKQVDQKIYDEQGNVIREWDKYGIETTYIYNEAGQVTSVDPAGPQRTEYTYTDAGLLLETRVIAGDESRVTSFEYTPENKLAKISYPNSAEATFSYNTKGQLIEQSTPQEGNISYTYDSRGRIKAKVHTDTKAKLTYSYDAAGQPTTITDASGNRTRVIYNKLGNIGKITDPRGNAINYEYTANGNLDSTTDEAGNVSTILADNSENITAQGLSGEEVRAEYDAKNRKTTEIDQLGNRTEYEYDDQDNLIATRTVSADEELVSETRYKYDSRNRLVEETDPLGEVTKYFYDEQNQIREIMNPLGEKQWFWYDDWGNVVRSQDFGGQETRYEYNQLGQKLAEIDAAGNRTEYAYDLAGRITKITDALGQEELFEYDGAGNLVKEVNKAGNAKEYVYNRLGQLVKEINFDGGSITFAYDKNGNLTRQTDAEGGVVKYTYTKDNQVATMTDELGNVTKYTYDSAGRQLTETDANKNVTQFAYNPRGELVKITYANGGEVSYTYDALGNRISETDQVGSTTQHKYNAASQLLATTDPAGNKTSYTYDKLGRTKLVTNALGDTKEYIYNPQGYIAQYINEGGYTTNYVYDKLGQVTTLRNDLNDSQHFEYDALGRLSTSTDFLGNKTIYEYDELGNKVKETDPNGLEIDFNYDQANRLLVQSIPSMEIEESWTYDKLGRMLSYTDPEGAKTRYKYDAAGNKTRQTDAEGGNNRYQYNKIGLLVRQINELNASTRFDYDAVGNLKEQIDANGNKTKYAYDLAGRQTSITQADSGVQKFDYNLLGQLTHSTDTLGNSTTYTYDVLGRLVRQTEPGDAAYAFEYDALGNVLQTTDPLGNEEEFVYDALSNLVEQTDKLGLVTKFTYDANQNLVKENRPNGGVYSYSYDALNRLLQINAPENTTTKYTLDPLGRTTAIQDANGNTTQFNLNKRGEVIAEILPDGASTTYAYDKLGNQVSETNPLGNKTTYKYDADSKLLEVRDALNGRTRYAYDNNGNLIREINANNASTRYSYDSMNRVVQEINPVSARTRYTYDTEGNLVSETDANGNTTTYAYGARQNMVSQTLPGSLTTTYAYDKINNLIAETTPTGQQTSYEYDALQRLTKTIDPLGNAASQGYTSTGQVASITNPAGHSVTYAYDNLDRLVSVMNALESSTTYSYDNLGNLLSETDANGNTTTYSYDARNQMVSETNTLGHRWQYEYDAAGNMVGETRPDNTTITYAHDALNRVTATNYDDADINTTLKYDKVGNITEAKNGTNRLRFNYDAADQLIKSVDSRGLTTKYTYTKTGQLARTIYPDNTRADYAYNANDLLETLTVNKPTRHKTTYAYDSNLNLSSITRPNDTITDYAYDSANRLTSIETNTPDSNSDNGMSTLQKLDYALDKNGNITQEVLVDNRGITTTSYGYDQLQRIRSANSTRQVATASGSTHKTEKICAQTFEYDKVGNRTVVETTELGITNRITASYNKANQLVQDSNYDYTYDQLGNLTSKTPSLGAAASADVVAENYVYNAANQQIEHKVAGAAAISFQYDALGRRATQTTEDATIRYAYDRLAYEPSTIDYNRNFDYSVHTNYMRVGDTILEAQNVASKRGIATISQFPLLGKLESVRGITTLDNPGTLVANRDYKPFGELVEITTYVSAQPHAETNLPSIDTDESRTTSSASSSSSTSLPASYSIPSSYTTPTSYTTEAASYALPADTSSSSAVEANRPELPGIPTPTPTNGEAYGFAPAVRNFSPWLEAGHAGQTLDASTNNYSYGARYLDTQIGRWTQQDTYRGTIQQPATRHRYAFVNNNPVNLVDEDGFRIQSNSPEEVAQYIATLNNQKSNIETALTVQNQALDSQNQEVARLKAQETKAFWQSYGARMEYHTFISLRGVVGRLASRGYNMDFNAAFNYLGSQIASTGTEYSIAQTNLARARQSLSNARAYSAELSKSIKGIQKSVRFLEKEISSANKTLEDIYLNGFSVQPCTIDKHNTDFLGTLFSPIDQVVQIEINKSVRGSAQTDAQLEYQNANESYMRNLEILRKAQANLDQLLLSGSSDTQAINRLMNTISRIDNEQFNLKVKADRSNSKINQDRANVIAASEQWYNIPVLGAGYSWANAATGYNQFTGEKYGAGERLKQFGGGALNVVGTAGVVYLAPQAASAIGSTVQSAGTSLLTSKAGLTFTTTSIATYETALYSTLGLGGTGLGLYQCSQVGCTPTEYFFLAVEGGISAYGLYSSGNSFYNNYKYTSYVPQETASTGRTKNQLTPDAKAVGDHTTFSRDTKTGNINHYETWTQNTNPKDPRSWDSVLRFDATGKPHFSKYYDSYIPTPHVHDPLFPGGVRAPNPGEIPK